MNLKKKITYQLEIEIECENPDNEFTTEEMEKGLKSFIKDEIEGGTFNRFLFDIESGHLRVNEVNFKRIENE